MQPELNPVAPGDNRIDTKALGESTDAMRVLGLETTCDETAAAVVRLRPDGSGEILADEIMSQIAAHAAYGGVVPEIAARAHVEVLDELIGRALEKAKVKPADLDGVAAAAGPGLIGGVLVGLSAGKGVAVAASKPFLAINHLEGHALIPRLDGRLEFPYLLLLASGGHTQILAVEGVGQYVRLGATMDDAIGEAFDKTAKLLGLGYPGGPAVEAAALSGDLERFKLPRPMLGRPTADFSLSGLKTAVRHAAMAAAPLTPQDVADLCASFQAAVVDTIEDRLRVALGLYRQRGGAVKAIVVAGGVAANLAIRAALSRFAQQSGLPLVAPPVRLCTDNGAMIAWAGIERLRLGQSDPLDAPARARWPLDPKAERARNNKA
jgi:N6-L-threonylcarbamoyladenine synthase